ncbi:hypothetical protein VE02_09100 [Pseudogymnoascus sp. 03VT05]|nr:hypothetical protein VE02_09100 [Pseudogymnoascus sp. 03VT05]
MTDGTVAHERHRTFYADDAKLIMGDKTAVGRDEILELRKSMWSAISSRRHTYTFYTSPEKPQTYMLEGEVAYEFRAGGKGIVR